MVDLKQGDCLELIKDLPNESVDIELDENYFEIAKERRSIASNYREIIGDCFYFGGNYEILHT